MADEWESFDDEEKEYEDSIAGRFEEAVDKAVEMRLSISNGIADQVKTLLNGATGKNEEDEDYEPGPVVKALETINSIDEALVQGTADVIKGIGRTVLGIF